MASQRLCDGMECQSHVCSTQYVCAVQPLHSLLPPPPHHQVYGAYYRRLSKKVQTELAEANSVAEEALSRWARLAVQGAAQCMAGADTPVCKAFKRDAQGCLLSQPLLGLAFLPRSMTTVKAHAAEDSTMAAYAVRLLRFYHLQRRWVGALAGGVWFLRVAEKAGLVAADCMACNPLMERLG